MCLLWNHLPPPRDLLTGHYYSSIVVGRHNTCVNVSPILPLSEHLRGGGHSSDPHCTVPERVTRAADEEISHCQDTVNNLQAARNMHKRLDVSESSAKVCVKQFPNVLHKSRNKRCFSVCDWRKEKRKKQGKAETQSGEQATQITVTEAAASKSTLSAERIKAS